jgi:hypothetical protein
MVAEGVLVDPKEICRFPHREAAETLLGIRWEGFLCVFTQPATEPLGHDVESLRCPYPAHHYPQVFIVL